MLATVDRNFECPLVNGAHGRVEGGNLDLVTVHEQPVASVEHHVLPIDPAPTAANPARVELREGLGSLDQGVRRGFPVGAGLVGELALPELQRGEPHQVELRMGRGREAHNLLPAVGHVEERVTVDPEQAERKVGDAIIPETGLVWRCRALPRRDRLIRAVIPRRRLGCLHGRWWWRCRTLDVLDEASPIPSLGDGVGQVPPVGHASGHRDRADGRRNRFERGHDVSGGFVPRLVSVRPDEHLPARERRPVSEFDRLPSAGPCHDHARRDGAGGVGGFLALHDQDAGLGVGGEQVEAVERARLGKREPPPLATPVLVLAVAPRDHVLAPIGQVEPADVAERVTRGVMVSPCARGLAELVVPE